VKLIKSALAVLGVRAKPIPAIARVNRLRERKVVIVFMCLCAPNVRVGLQSDVIADLVPREIASTG